MRTALQYTQAIMSACVANRDNLRRSYRYKAGALKFAREYGYGLNDFPAAQRDPAMKRSYALIAKGLYGPKPPVSKADWEKEVTRQYRGV